MSCACPERKSLRSRLRAWASSIAWSTHVTIWLLPEPYRFTAYPIFGQVVRLLTVPCRFPTMMTVVDQPSGQLLADEGEAGPRVAWVWDDGTRIAIHHEEDVEWRPWPRPGGKWYLPSRFSALIETPSIPNAVEMRMRVTEDGQTICSSLTVWRARTLHYVVQTERMEQPHDMSDTTVSEISSESLRKVPASRLVRWAVLAACHAVPGVEGRRDPPSLDEWSTLFATEGKRRRRRLDDRHFQEVAAVYRAAVKFGTPTRAVAAHFTAGESTAGRWVVEARRRGFLGKTSAGRPGEQSFQPHEGDQQ